VSDLILGGGAVADINQYRIPLFDGVLSDRQIIGHLVQKFDIVVECYKRGIGIESGKPVTAPDKGHVTAIANPETIWGEMSIISEFQLWHVNCSLSLVKLDTNLFTARRYDNDGWNPYMADYRFGALSPVFKERRYDGLLWRP